MRSQRLGRRGFLQAVAAAGSTLFFAGGAGAVPAKDRMPNIVFMLADDMGWRDGGVFGSSFYETPNIDRLAAGALRFTNAYAANPLCSPTRASILTGAYPARLHLTNYLPGGLGWLPEDAQVGDAELIPHLPEDYPTLAELLKDAGYDTAILGKWHLGFEPPHLPEQRGFDLNIDEPHQYEPGEAPDHPYFTDVMTKQAVRYLEERGEKPFFLYLPYFAVHIPIEARQDKVVKYQRKLEEMPETAKEHDNPHYAAMLESMDDSIGAVLDALERLGLAENTIVVFFSDNGGLTTDYGNRLDEMGVGEWQKHTPPTTNAPLREGKGHLYEGGIREPCIIRWPGVTPKRAVCDEPIISNDFFPTLLAAAGVKDPSAHSDGVNLRPLLEEPDAKLEREALFWHYPHYSNEGGRPSGGVRVGDWKLIESYETHEVELFNLAEDIGERNNLAAAKPEKARALQERLHAWLKDVDANMPGPKPLQSEEPPNQ